MSTQQTDNASVEVTPKRRPRRRWIVVAGVAVLVLVVWMMSGTGGTTGSTLSFQARRGPLDIKVLAGGPVEALESQRIVSEIRGETKILQIVEEGYSVTEEDVKNGKVLVTLDNSKILEDLTQQEIQYQGADAGYTEAKEQFQIQVKQNESLIKSAELAVKFARMDLEKYVGADPATKLIAFLDEEVNTAPPPVLRQSNGDEEDVGPREGENPAENSEHPRGDWRNDPEMRERFERMRREGGADGMRREGGEGAAPDAAGTGRRRGGDGGGENRSGTGEGGGERRRSRPPEGTSPTSDAGSTNEQLAGALAADAVAPEVVKQAIDAVKTKTTEESKTQAAPEVRDAGEKVSITSDVQIEEPRPSLLNFVDMKSLEGEAEQLRRQLESKRIVSEQETMLAKNRLDWTKKLREKDFVTQTELETDEMKVLQSEIDLESAKTAEDLFIKYEFPKQVEKLSSDYQEALRKLDVTKRQATSELAESEARLRSAEATYSLQKRRRDELREQMTKTDIRAERVGLVVYAGSGREYRRSDQQIEEGASVYERQEIITIPDMTRMAVNVKVHESVVKQVQRGQKAKIWLESFADEELQGEVTKVSVIPDSSSRWMNPDLKVYPTTVTIDGTYNWVLPGMTAKVEILVKQLPDVVYVPIQAVFESEGKRVVYISKATGYEKREVTTGESNQEFIEIKSGLEESEYVLLRIPEEERIKQELRSEQAEAVAPAAEPAAPVQ